MLLQFGCNINVKDKVGDTPFYYAKERQHSDIMELLLFASMGASESFIVKNKIKLIEKQQSIINILLIQFKDNNNIIYNLINNYLINCINNKLPFSDLLLMLYYNYIKNQNKNNNFKNTKLYKIIINNFKDILNNPLNKKNWCWLKHYLLPSNIWYFNNSFNDILKLCNNKSNEYSKIYLNSKINIIKKEKNNEWNKMIIK